MGGQSIFIILTFLTLQNNVSAYNNEKFSQIHKSIKRRDLSRIFGVEDSTKVPLYEVFSPFIKEDIIKTRGERINKRDIKNSEKERKTRTLKLGIPAFQKTFHLNLTENIKLFTSNFKIETKTRNGTVVKRNVDKNCYFHGDIHGNSIGLAAMSTCYGQLRGMFTTDTHHYFVEPVPDYLHKSGVEIYQIPHIVYRRSVHDTNTPVHSWLHSLLGAGGEKQKNQPLRMMKRSEEGKPIPVQIPVTSGTASASSSSVSGDSSSLDNNERYIETLVVVDQKMVHYHGEDAATQFALVVMNNVARLLRDSSIGNNLIILVLDKLQLHTVDVPGLVINHHARNTLKSFGNWAQLSSDVDDRSDDHFDYAILLTRYNICADKNQPCDNRGLTETGGMCLWPYSASVNEDSGLQLVYTVAHNIGHSLGMNHDGDESSFICPENEFIMASVVSGDWKPNRNHWSRCSRNYLRQFLKKEQANCLLDLPVFLHSVDYEKMDSKPGLLYEINKQCEMQFGTGSKLCNKNIENVCASLSCSNPANADKCFRSLYPAADGTKCEDNKFCFHGKCISSSSEMASVDGGWSSWSDDYEACSRSCGGGVQYRKRHCAAPKPSNGGKYCEGEPRIHRLCNTQKCSNETSVGTFRSLQCSKLNGRLFGERKFEWEFKPSKIASCELGCFIAQTGHGYNFGNVEDGTNCDQMDDALFTDKCINGQCVPVGCDKKLGSKMKFDRCGICDGDGLKCVTGSERSNIADNSVSAGGISDALKSLRDMGFDMNHLNGQSSLELSGKRSGIARKEDYGWARIKSGCSFSCGGGIETVIAECRRLDDGSPVREDHCDHRSKPPMQQYPCKEEACSPVFQTSYWGDCSKTCNGGFKRRNVRCVQKSGNGVEYDVDSTLCAGMKPLDTEGCNKEPCPAEWIAQPFGECSTICGAGLQTRDTFCQKTLKDGNLVTLHHDDCRKETKPPTEQSCNVHNPCPGDSGCGGIYTTEHGNFTSPGFPDKYPSDMECVHIIQVPKEKVIKLNFEKMNVESADKECRNDFVKVMDGDCVSRLGESKFCGKTVPPSFISTTNRLCVKFFSDDSQNDQGFLAKYEAIEHPSQMQDQCNSNLTAPDGLLSSPNYPEFYPQNEDCNITVTTEEKPIKVKFHAFDVGNENCDNDYVILTGGTESKKFCGQRIPGDYISKDNVISVRFVSSSHQTQQRPGFVATYTSGLSEVSRSKIPRKPKNTTMQNFDLSKKNEIPKQEKISSIWKSSFVKTTGSDDTVAKEVQTKTKGKHDKKDIINQHADTIYNNETGSEMFPPTDNTTNATNLNNSTNATNVNNSTDVNNTTTTTSRTMLNANSTKVENNTNIIDNKTNATTLQNTTTATYNTSTTTKTTNTTSATTLGNKTLATNNNNTTTTTNGHVNVAFIKTSESDGIEMDIKLTDSNNKKIASDETQSSFKANEDVKKYMEPRKKVHALSKAQLLFINAMKDDTPKWIPEPANKEELKKVNKKKDRIKPHEITFKKHSKVVNSNKKHEISKKTYITKPVSYIHNLDGIKGECPTSLRCIDLLMSYPCSNDGRCGPGLSCCQTSCGYLNTQRMCLPRVTKHCPIQLPYQKRLTPCGSEADCPLRSTCCLDLGNHKYCRYLKED